MNSMSEREEKILSVANYIIENETTIGDTANAFGLSSSCVKKYINDENNLQRIDYGTYIIVKEIQNKIEHNGKIKGGKTGKRKRIISEDDIRSIAMQIINNGWTLEDASTKLSIPTSTIYDRIRSIQDVELQNELDIVFEDNRRGR